jgi:hypothetical protein
MHIKKSGQFPTFNGQEIWLPTFLLIITCVSNGQCKPILDISFSIDFQWYKKLFELMSFYPCDRALKIQESIRIRTPNMEFTWKCEGSFLDTLWHSQEHEMWLSGFPFGRQPCNPLALVASPKVGLRQISNNKKSQTSM